MTLGQLLNGTTISKSLTAFLVALIGSTVILLHGGAISTVDLEHAAELAAASGLATFLVPNRPTTTGSVVVAPVAPVAPVAAPEAVPALAVAAAIPGVVAVPEVGTP